MMQPPKRLGLTIVAGLALAAALAGLHWAQRAQAEDEFGRRFVAALNQDSPEAMAKLLITREEFERLVWPNLPAAAPGWNVTPGDVWELYAMKTGPGIRRTLSDWGGKSLTYVAIRFAKTDQYDDLVIRREPVIVTQTPTGETVEIATAGPVAVHEGDYKLLSFAR